MPLPAGLPTGYHQVDIRLGGLQHSTRLIVAPARAYASPALAGGAKAAGIALALYGVRSARNWGCGDLRDLHGVVDWVAEDAHASFIALNPLHAIYNRRPYNTSPYLPECIFYPNYLYLDVESIEDFRASRRAQRLWSQPETQRQLAALRDSEYVEYEQVAAWKLRFLKLAFAGFLREHREGSARALEFSRFLADEGDLLRRFATYCALDEYLHARHPDLWTWPDWPAPYQDPDSPETQAFRKKHWRLFLFYGYVQWQLSLQLAAAQSYARERGLSIGLYHDLALATDRFGADLWAQRRFFASGCRVGSPPDDFSPKGQDWGFPPPCSDAHRDDGYRLFTESIRKNCRYGGALRIDHVMRFFRLFWIPEGTDATAGAYVRENYEDLIRILALESVRQRVVIIGEDLGTVEPFVRETLDRFGILSYRLFYFEKRADKTFKTFAEYPERALVSSTTHDLPTLAGFWTGEDIEARRARRHVPRRHRVPPAGARARRRETEDAGLVAQPRPAAGLCPQIGGVPARDNRGVAQCSHRIPGTDAFPTPGRQPGGSDQRDRAAKPARHHLAVPELEPQDEIHAGAVAHRTRCARLCGYVPQLAGADRARESDMSEENQGLRLRMSLAARREGIAANFMKVFPAHEFREARQIGKQRAPGDSQLRKFPQDGIMIRYLEADLFDAQLLFLAIVVSFQTDFFVQQIAGGSMGMACFGTSARASLMRSTSCSIGGTYLELSSE